jgi:hypothetical protein
MYLEHTLKLGYNFQTGYHDPQGEEICALFKHLHADISFI